MKKSDNKNRDLDRHQIILSIFDSMSCAVVATNTNSQILMLNPVAEALTGWKQDEALGKDFAEVVNLVDQDMEEGIDNLAMQAMAAGKVLHLPENCLLITKDGTRIPIGDSIAPIWDSDGKITGAVLVLQDITERKRREEQLLHHAIYDSLTGLPNRVLFLDRLRKAIESCQGRNDNQFAVLFLDLDGFKNINDYFGHGIGDEVLMVVARRLESCLRSGDTAARFGGDEFAILLENIHCVQDAITVARRIQNALDLPIIMNRDQIFTTVSIGIVVNSSYYQEPTKILQDADTAMYQAKQQGKASYVVVGGSMSPVP
jgi:diguanylate cyclase (GGDEF)-like protein/PAS domain S-box-containing protein